MTKQALKFLGLILILLAVAAGVYFIFFVRKPASPPPKLEEVLEKVRKFNGSPISLQGNQVTLNGVFLAGQSPDSLSATREFIFSVDEKTKFKKKEIQLPKWEDLTAKGATSGTFDFKDLPQTAGEGTLDDFKKSISTYKGDVSVEAAFLLSTYNSTNPVASSVYYEIMIVPPPPQIP